MLERLILPKGDSRQRTKTTRQRRPRRSTEEIIDRLLEAAGTEFERNGYAGTKTAAIARKAGVAEPLIFNHFGSKAKLFHDSIFKPLDRHFLQFCATHLVDVDDAEGMREGTRQYILELQEFIRRHSRMLRSLVAAQMYESRQVKGLSHIEGLHDYFSRGAARTMSRLVAKPKIDPRLITRVSFATILACIIFKDWLFPEGLASEDELRAAITGFVMEGLEANAAATMPKTARPGRSRRLPGAAKAT
jgi:AcrR family transcriptional regulator